MGKAVHLDVVDDDLTLRLTGAPALLSLCRRLEVPVAAVEGVAVAPRRLVPQTGLRLPGTSIPGRVRAGSFGTGTSRDFWAVGRAEEVLVVHLLPGQRYRRWVLEVPDPRETVLRLRPVLGAWTGSFT